MNFNVFVCIIFALLSRRSSVRWSVRATVLRTPGVKFSKPKGFGTAGPMSMSLGMRILRVSGENIFEVEF